jgi:hypothetical protein
MPYGSISDYRGVVGDRIEQGANIFLEVYNTLTTTLSNGVVYKVIHTADSTYGNYPTLTAVTTDSVGITQVAVVNNSIMDKGVDGIAGSSWGYVQTGGECPKVNVYGATTIGNALLFTVANALVLTDASNATLALTTVGIARSSTTAAGSVSATLLGFRVSAS